MFVALLIATGAGLAPPYLAGQAIDDGIIAGDVAALDLIVVAFVASAIALRGRHLRADLPGRLGRHRGRCRTCASGSSPTSRGCRSASSPATRPGVLISRMTNDIEALNQLVTDGVVTLFSSTLTLVGVVVILLFLDVQLALVTFLTFPLLAIASVVFRIVSAGAYRLTRERIAAITAYLQETPERGPGRAQLRPGAAPRRPR